MICIESFISTKSDYVVVRYVDQHPAVCLSIRLSVGWSTFLFFGVCDLFDIMAHSEMP